MATTKTLEEDYWHGRRQTEEEIAAGRRITRHFKVPRASFDSLAPAPGTDTAHGDSTFVVTGIGRAPISAVLEWMFVTYLKRAAGASPI